MNIKYDKTPNGKYRALAINTDAGYGLAYRAFGKDKSEAKKNLLTRLEKK